MPWSERSLYSGQHRHHRLNASRKNMAKIAGGDNPASQKMIASRMEAISPACFPSRRALVALDEHIDEEPHLGGEMAAMGVKKVDVVGFDLELLQ